MKMKLCRYCVWQIERIQNTTLWQSYQLMKTQMEVKNKHKNNERQLFHGTDGNSVNHINQRGFDRGFAGTHGNIPEDVIVTFCAAFCSCLVSRSCRSKRG